MKKTQSIQSKGGYARANSMTKKQRSAIARKAATVRWDRVRMGVVVKGKAGQELKKGQAVFKHENGKYYSQRK